VSAPDTGEGVSFPRSGDGRPTTPTARGMVADAVAGVRPDLAERIASGRSWRTEYVGFLREITAASAADGNAALAIAERGLRSMRHRLVLERDGDERPLDERSDAAGPVPSVRTVAGGAEPVRELRVPYRGGELRGPALLEQVERWVQAGTAEPSFATAIRRVVDHPEWLALPGRRIALIGAGAEMGPLAPLCAWGADVVAIDLPDDDIWDRLEGTAARGAGTMALPVLAGGRRGIDVVRAMPEAREWLDRAAAGDRLVLGMYAYADGASHVRVTAAADAIAADLLDRRRDTALAWLATPTDAFVVPEDVVRAARARHAARGWRRYAQAPLRAVSRGRLFRPPYADGVAVADVLVPQQGPNYALAKRLQRWRGAVAQRAGGTVSFNVAPASWTRSVTKNRMLAAAYAGAGRFGVEIFAAETARVLMGALLVHDLNAAPAAPAHPEMLFSEQAAHGGLWRAAYEPRSVLGVAALAGLPRALRG
jgi:hypothetical protein